MGNYLSKSSTSDPLVFATPFDGTEFLTAEQSQEAWKTYDYIIVGAGAAGCVLANRLPSNPRVSVLLIEAGLSNVGLTPAIIPGAFVQLFKSKYDWQYNTVPQPELNNRECYWPRGKMLGGSISMNAMVYHHGSPSDFDEWEKLGATGWNYDNMAPYFRRAEKFTPHVKYPEVRVENRGDSGPWLTSFIHTHPVVDQFVLAAKEFSTFIGSNGLRSSAATAYLSPSAVARENLTIATESQTTRVIFSTEGVTPRAIGVEIATSRSPGWYRAAARKEVILSAGALGTPQIMMLSGAGPREELEKFDIPIIKDLPAVGKNLSDHLATAVVFRAKYGTSLDWIMSSRIKTVLPRLEWYLFGTGSYTSNAVEAGCFVRTTNDKLPYTSGASIEHSSKVRDTASAPNSPDMEIIFFCCGYLDQGFKPVPTGTSCFSLCPTILRPLSKGQVSLKSASPFDKPLFNPNYFTHPNDMKVLIRGVRLALRIGRAKALEPVFRLENHYENKNNDLWLGDADPDRITDEEIIEHIRGDANSMYHPACTCKMGQDEKQSVVGPDLKVHGINGLGIADASIFPEQISGHVTAAIIAIGGKASDIILNSV